ncbi:GRIP1-associated protein 1 [Platysternon megacephalum]|uniref:GRIP1-associated protein 1 n=1 Tax=Platysternon megacephalum TaxID=55544 RepID=A0A4D9DCR5_9SAUR|nr:GRIP1-associated protein 1 [Platysternon megacephalum]
MALWPSRSLALLLCAAGALLLLPAGDPGSWGRALPLLLLAGGAALLRLCARPLALRRAPERVGYLPEPGCSRRQAARRARRSRRAGELPPLYPNGWYRLLDSPGLPRGGVRSLAALGECGAGGCSEPGSPGSPRQNFGGAAAGSIPGPAEPPHARLGAGPFRG